MASFSDALPMKDASPIKIVALISGNGSNLQAIIDAIAERGLNAKICAVISNIEQAYGLQRASKAGIPAVWIDHKKYSNREQFDQALIEAIDPYQPDLIVLAGFMRILTEPFVCHYQGRLINIHPSLLPRFRGLNTHQRVIEEGDSEHGASIHFVTPDLDGGPVIVQARISVEANDSAETLAQKVQQQEHKIYPQVVEWFCDNRIRLNQNKVYLDGNELHDRGYSPPI
ncbi:MAG: phosphoribosylglycinamide formyltransferase [Pseudomonadales bacterium]|nr:phosphoribosylglycinamide formyltransferase [Pseudomonadales bacterium]